MNSKCRETQYSMLDWYYDEEETKKWDREHVQNCRECGDYLENLLQIERELPKESIEFHAPEAFARALEDHVRNERNRVEEKKEKRSFLKELGAFPAVAFFFLVAMGSFFYYDVGPSFIQLQLMGLLIFPLVIPILAVFEKNPRQGRDSYGS